MKPSSQSFSAFVLLSLLAWIALGSTTATASIKWTWSFDGHDGYFITDGDLLGGLAVASTYNVLDFGVTAAGSPAVVLGSISGGQWNEGAQPGTGFIWDGSQPTEYFRDGGPLTNGANYYDINSNRLLFYPGYYSTNVATANATASITPDPTPVPEPGGALLLGAIGTVLTLKRRRSAPRQAPTKA